MLLQDIVKKKNFIQRKQKSLINKNISILKQVVDCVPFLLHQNTVPSTLICHGFPSCKGNKLKLLHITINTLEKIYFATSFPGDESKSWELCFNLTEESFQMQA